MRQSVLVDSHIAGEVSVGAEGGLLQGVPAALTPASTARGDTCGVDVA